MKLINSIFLILFLSTPAFPADTVAVDLDTVIQKNFLGINAVYHAFTYMPESTEQGMTKELRQTELQRLAATGLHLARTFYRPDWAMGKDAWSEPDWQSDKMQALYSWLADMQKNNVDVALNMGWWFGRDVIWNRDQHLPTYPDDIEKYAAWVSESLHQIIELRGFVNVKYIFMFTEPGGSYGDIPHAKKTWDYYKEVVLATHKQLRADGRRHLVRMVGPNTTEAPRWIKKAAGELGGVIDIFASHNYNFITYKQWYDLAVKVRQQAAVTGKPFWIDEYGVQDFSLRKSALYGNILAQANAAFLNAGAQTSLLWILSDQYYPYPLKYITNGDAFVDGLHQWGLSPWLPEDGGVRPAWYAFAMMSRLMGGEGSVVYKTSGLADLHVAATGQSAGGLSILLVNGSDSGRKFNLTINGRVSAPLYRYVYDPAKVTRSLGNDLAMSDRQPVLTTGGLQGRLPPKAVVIYSTDKLKRGLAYGQSPVSPDFGNAARGGKARSSSSVKGHGADRLIDGTRLFYWSSKKKNIDTAEFVTIDLGKKHSLNHVAIYPRSDRQDMIGAGFPVDYMLELSKDAKTWRKVASGHGVKRPDATALNLSFSPSQVRYLRLTGTKLRRINESGVYAMQIGEIKMFVSSP